MEEESGTLVSDACAVAIPRSGRGSKKRTTAGGDPPGKETEVLVVVDITPMLPAKRARKPSGRKAAAHREWKTR